MEKLLIANLPTPIQKLNQISNLFKKNIYVKRDDFTGIEYSGNKVRKLEYVFKDIMESESDVVITAGSIQSNHCRATAAVCARLGLECHLVLRKTEIYHNEGNLWLNQILGAKLHIINSDEDRNEYMESLKERLSKEGRRPYTIPIGASNALGSFGYSECFNEILDQEKELELSFDTIVLPVGSGGTYAGLWYANESKKANKEIIGFSVDSSSEEFKKEIIEIVNKMDDQVDNFDSILINDQYIGDGYAKSTEKEIEFYIDIAQKEGIIFDPCYTGKAFRGMYDQLSQEKLPGENILFIHTGGLMGWTKEDEKIALDTLATINE